MFVVFNTYYVVVTSYDADGNESWYSNELVSYGGCTTYTACNYDPDAFFEIFRVEHAPAPNNQESDPDPYNPDDQAVITPELF